MTYTIMTRLDFLCDRCGGEKNKIIDLKKLDNSEMSESWVRILRTDDHNMACITCADTIDITLLLVDLHDKIDSITGDGKAIFLNKKVVGEFTEKDEKD